MEKHIWPPCLWYIFSCFGYPYTWLKLYHYNTQVLSVTRNQIWLWLSLLVSEILPYKIFNFSKIANSLAMFSILNPTHPRTNIYFHVRWFCHLSVCLSVCVCVSLCRNVWSDFDEIYRIGQIWFKEQLFKLCRTSSGFFRICFHII